jgi:hypothetical protein
VNNNEQINISTSVYNNPSNSGGSKSMVALVGVIILFIAGAIIFAVRGYLMVENTKVVVEVRDQALISTFKEQINKIYLTAQNQFLTESITGDKKFFEINVDDSHKCYIYDLDNLSLPGINKASGYYGTVALCYNNDSNKVDKSGVALSNDKYHTDGFILINNTISDDDIKDESSDLVAYLKNDMSESDIKTLTNDLLKLLS